MKSLRQILMESSPNEEINQKTTEDWKGHRCYEYAVGCRKNPNHPLPSIPGATGKAPMKNLGIGELIRGLEADGAIHAGSGQEIPPPKPGHRLIYAATSYGHANGSDFHFYKQHPDGKWSHKLHHDVSTKDASGKEIVNPAKADRNYSNHLYGGLHGLGKNYDVAGAFFYIPEHGLVTTKAVPPPQPPQFNNSLRRSRY